MEKDIFEASLTPEMLERMRGDILVTGEGTTGYGPLDRSPQALEANLKAPTFDNERVWRLLRGSYDIHLHGGPSSTTQRLYDEADLAIHFSYMGLAGFVSKNHDSPSTRSMILAEKVGNKWAEEHNKKKVELFGGVVLNHAVGGLNPEAVISVYRLGGKYVWLPSLDANHHRRVVGQCEGQGIDLIDENDNVVPKMKEILELMANTDLVLGVGHQSTKERLLVVKEAVKMGVKRIEVNHVNFPMTWLTPEQCKMFADLGAYIGIYAMDMGVMYKIEDVIAIYKEIGPERIVFASDCGATGFPHPVDAMRRLIAAFLYRGVPDEHVKLMCQSNAYNLLH